MTFFNKQEEVLEVRLTQAGKKMLSIGQFNPVYYAFYDDDVMYDYQYISGSETQNEAEARIKQSISLRTQHLVESVQDSFEKESLRISRSESFDTLPDLDGRGRHRRPRTPGPFTELQYFPKESGRKILKYPLCSARARTQQSPGFKVTCLEGKIYNSASIEYKIQHSRFSSIPEIVMKPKYVLERHVETWQPQALRKHRFRLIDSESGIDLTSKKLTFDDNTYLLTKEENIILNIAELGVEYTLENFTIECYETLSSSVDGEEDILLTEKEVYDLFSFETDNTIPKKTSMDMKTGNFYIEE